MLKLNEVHKVFEKMNKIAVFEIDEEIYYIQKKRKRF
jgi:hypothetical protein